MLMIEAVRQTQKKYGSRAMIVAIVVAFGCILAGYPTFGKGLIIGTLFSIVNFVIMGETLPMRLGHSSRKSALVSFFVLVLRYGILSIPLILAVKTDQYNLVSVIIGIFLIQILIISERFTELIHPISRR